jgi:hypothetical protein
MMNVPLRVQFHIPVTLESGEDKAWEYNPCDHILIVDLHKLFILVYYDDKEQMSNILAHIHLRVIDHFIIHAYVDSYTRIGYDGRSMTLYHHINIECFPKLDDLVRNPPPEVHVTYKLHGDVDDNNE